MARVARIVIPGLPHHIVHRAKPEAQLFRDEIDYARYQDLLRHNCALYAVDLRAFCLMPDHVHAVMAPTTAQGLSRAIGETGRLYTRYRGADLWRGRFQSCPLDDAHGEAAIAYVRGNPGRLRLGPWPWRYPEGATDEASAQQIEAIRKSTRTGRPAGSPEFYARLEYDLGRRLSPRKRGRKAKW
jgi:putative transposase